MGKNYDEEQETLTAYHEAGHCVMAWIAGAEIELATICPEKDDGPRRWGDVQARWNGKPKWYVAAMVHLAGPASELVYRDENLHPAFIAEFVYDWKAADRVCQKALPNPGVRLGKLEEAASELILFFRATRVWEATSLLADELLAHETLDEEMIADTLQRFFPR
jgi:hypothetical protein